ncbi:unnamed protein product [Rhizophagus irregularis]|uniref:Uncharacterized protein n=1 Tax=Rhizophagus irregularis TaxID=588596 RepID=A0A915ZT13_9GLOM|nr:hypothetical protein RIR_jg2616.t1 [Rhizophagus irregularis DAOM 181602=DAOM 197198]CAB5387049.1 unnamed protein product [Rhizophagus irregularis]
MHIHISKLHPLCLLNFCKSFYHQTFSYLEVQENGIQEFLFDTNDVANKFSFLKLSINRASHLRDLLEETLLWFR